MVLFEHTRPITTISSAPSILEVVLHGSTTDYQIGKLQVRHHYTMHIQLPTTHFLHANNNPTKNPSPDDESCVFLSSSVGCWRFSAQR